MLSENKNTIADINNITTVNENILMNVNLHQHIKHVYEETANQNNVDTLFFMRNTLNSVQAVFGDKIIYW